VTDLQAQLTAALADRYVIERKLGEGGMAVVYLANDVKHDRPVAVKVLHPDLAASIGAERFLREIQITARLSHPHILPLYDSGAADGFLYYVMPYVVGESLSDLMEREKQLSLEEAIRITREVAEALAYAHSMGLVHRDIKPDNVMMSGGHAIVADFGIARAVSEAGGDKLTQTGMAVGTPAYMSPEQAAGEENVDGRSDIYSLGCVLYELVVGQVPFTGPTPMAVMARHSMDQVPPPHIMRQTVPEDLEDVIYVAMAKAPADRFRTAQEMVDALNAIGSDTGPHRRLSISAQRPARERHDRPGRIRKIALPAGGVVVLAALAFAGWRVLGNRGGASADAESLAQMSHIAVLYFQDRSPNKSLDYLASGLTEGLIQQLSNVGALHVISANGVRPYRNSDISSDSLRKVLGVGTLVEGTVAADGDRLRVHVSLVNARTDDNVADTTITAARQDIFALQDTLAQDVSRFLRKRLGTEVTIREERSGTRNAAAWEALQQAKQAEKDADTLAAAGDTTGVRRQYDRADSLLVAAEKLDAQWVVPTTQRGWLAFARARAPNARADEANRWSQEALTRAKAALETAPNDADALDLLGTVRFWRTLVGFVPDAAAAVALRDSAENNLTAAVQIDSTKADALSVLSAIYMNKGQSAQAKLYAQRAYEADPYLQNVDRTLWRLYSASFDLEDASQSSYWCAEFNHRFPKDPRAASCRIGVQALSTDPHRIDSAWAALRDFVALSPPGDSASNEHLGELNVALAIARASADRPALKDSARAVAARAVANTSSIDPTKDFHLMQAMVLGWVGDKDEAVREVGIWLAANPANRGGSPSDLPWEYKPLLDYPPFRSLMGYPPLK